ncbi:hypothetical protein ACFLYR_03875 [Chloroflexota bacterium]
MEKGIGISYPIGKPTNRKGGHTDEERIPQGTGIDYVRAGAIAWLEEATKALEQEPIKLEFLEEALVA